MLRSAHLLPRLAPLLLLLASVLFWFRLGEAPLHLWDEARLGVNALWVAHTGDWLILRADPGTDDPPARIIAAWQPPAPGAATGPGLVRRGIAAPDVWNTKPPLVPWLQALCLWLFDNPLLAIRLPAAGAGWLTVVVLYVFGWRVLRQPGVGVVAALVLATTPAFLGVHVSRTGDFDAPLVLFMTVGALSFWTYLQTRRTLCLGLAGAGLALALLTKCSAALLPLPALGLYVLAHRAYRPVLRDARLWLALGLALVPLLVFYAVRERAAPGYLGATWFNDWAGRATQDVSETGNPWWVYLQNLFTIDLSLWAPTGLALIGAGLWLGRRMGKAERFAWWYVAGMLVVLSAAGTRLFWYSAPVFPLLALALALRLTDVGSRLPRQRWVQLGGAAVVALLLSAQTVMLWRRELLAPPKPDAAGIVMRDGLTRLRAIAWPASRVVLLRDGFNSVLDFYLLALPPRPGLEILVRSGAPDSIHLLNPGTLVVGCSAPHYTALTRTFHVTPLSGLDAPWWAVRLASRK
ncbi:glycosyltransferase family 39 protein [Hymenobacter sp. BT175]|uniref:ArnT family glycosyltransferase n=1 Tax=Hymenobacter translucens TaxID=2886507 RepID=UPI001D0ECE17|nr:glycosyltransferase family 39 protein [Hymenobacter translucens]MCC2546084.1 glycosyltransferase family 39 protein [Hymenobacter translucens]